MSSKSRKLLSMTVAAVLFLGFLSTVSAAASASCENLAYSLGVQAYIYGYPLVVMERTKQISAPVKNANKEIEIVSKEF